MGEDSMGKKGKGKPLDAGKEVGHETAAKYRRGPKNKIKGEKDKKLKATLERAEHLAEQAMMKAGSAELLLTEEAGFLEAEGMEKNSAIHSAGNQGQRGSRSCSQVLHSQAD